MADPTLSVESKNEFKGHLFKLTTSNLLFSLLGLGISTLLIYLFSSQKFVDFSESDYGVALLNNGKYGATLRGSSVGLSLTKTPIYPDPSTDLEEITFVYSLYPHVGDWKRAEVVKRAYELNVPLRVVGGISEVKSESFIRVSDKLILEAVKVAEGDSNSIILRLYEYENTRGEAVVELPFNVIEARSLDLLELNEISRDIRTDGNRIKVKYKNRDILTISVRG